jgi:hypothetical protein
MSYRNDHDAALARVGVLEREVATLRERERDKAETPPLSPPRKPWWLVGACIGALTAGIVGGVALGASHGGERVADEPAPIASTFDTSLLDACSAVSCRDELHAVLDDASLGTGERDMLAEWAAAEDELAGAATRRDVYYANDPFTLDGYSTARQLEVEYERAIARRERAAARWHVHVRDH